MGTVNALDNFRIIGIYSDNSGLRLLFIQELLVECRNKAAENIS